MGVYRNLRNSWYTVLVIGFLSIIILLRRDLQKLLLEHKQYTNDALYDDSLFFNFAYKEGIPVVLSQSGEYMIYPNVRKPGLVIMSDEDVTFATHCSYSNLRYLPDLAKMWSGPLSVAVFTPSPTKSLILIDLMRKCSSYVENYVRFHIVYPFGDRLTVTPWHGLVPGEPDMVEILQHIKDNKRHENMVCHNLNALLQNLQDIEKNYDLLGVLGYPNNVLRNVAWDHAQTKYILNADIDLIPSFDMKNSFQNFAETVLSRKYFQNSKTVFVVPVFEIRRDYYEAKKRDFPINKIKLLGLASKDVVRPFYHEVCPDCQNCTNYKEWYKLEGREVNVAELEYHLHHPCEPYLILPRDQTPKYDERFKQYGYNRISQVCEVLAAGWQFQVLNNAFLIHIGYKEIEDGFHFTKERDMQRNFNFLQEFNSELRAKYKDSETFC